MEVRKSATCVILKIFRCALSDACLIVISVLALAGFMSGKKLFDLSSLLRLSRLPLKPSEVRQKPSDVQSVPSEGLPGSSEALPAPSKLWFAQFLAPSVALLAPFEVL